VSREARQAVRAREWFIVTKPQLNGLDKPPVQGSRFAFIGSRQAARTTISSDRTTVVLRPSCNGAGYRPEGFWTDRGGPDQISPRIGRKPATIDEGDIMKRMLIGAAAAALVAVPAAIGLWGNASFSQEVPVKAPASGQLVVPSPTPSTSPSGLDDHGGDTPRDQRIEPGDDRDVQGTSPAPAPAPAPAPVPSAPHNGVDDHGGDTPRDQRIEPGDDHGGSDSSRSGSSGSGSSGDDVDGDDHGGHGSDD
jgi:hypothetical protein